MKHYHDLAVLRNDKIFIFLKPAGENIVMEKSQCWDCSFGVFHFYWEEKNESKNLEVPQSCSLQPIYQVVNLDTMLKWEAMRPLALLQHRGCTHTFLNHSNANRLHKDGVTEQRQKKIIQQALEKIRQISNMSSQLLIVF